MPSDHPPFILYTTFPHQNQTPTKTMVKQLSAQHANRSLASLRQQQKYKLCFTRLPHSGLAHMEYESYDRDRMIILDCLDS